MGKAIPKAIKFRARVLLEERPELFSIDFEKNKRAIDSLKLPLYKSTRNLIAGFIVRTLKARARENN